jgi:hypothetical protein
MVAGLGINLQLETSLPPPIIYHYTSQDGLFGILESKSIWASKIQYLNDEQEFNLGLQVAREVIKEQLQSTPDEVKKRLLNQLVGDLGKVEQTNVCVCSFSRWGDLLSQWRGYCPNGPGYSIGFDTGKLNELAKSHNFLLVSCEYNPDAQKKVVSDSINQATKQLLVGSINPEETEIKKASWRMTRMIAVVAGFLKHASFSEESEWRLISTILDSRLPDFRYRRGQSLIIPYFRLSLITNSTEWPIKEVIVGPTPHPVLARDSVFQLLSSKGITDFSVRNSTIPYRNW